MSWISETKYRWYETLAMNIIRCGRVPRHIAFIMDGNRRFAKSEHIPKIDGHSKGFEKLAECLRWCLDAGIQEVTTFAFSIENFKRTEDEVNGLLDLAKEKFEKLLAEEDKLKQHGVRIRVIGNISLLPLELQQVIARAMICTEKNDKLFLNIALSYTSHDEMTQAVEAVLRHGSDTLESEDINERLLDECMYTRQSPAPDLLFRTSGESRISDFLMWQLSTTVLYFTRVLWPQITIWNFLASILTYQRASHHLDNFKEQNCRDEKHLIKTSSCFTDRVQSFLYRLDMYRREFLLKLSKVK
ncbi:dehydrodolichyl diphosphate synthase complex subunit DHDDS [Episyrphus balteatus]|uniref:dehydrodolichyl diphosphate synthase complex subunit DHDDS n=1 Tax=Episyrphus balteatus TaxID=286459 RepID=UPI002484EDC0|nr:dehydrodolichyl diphosphate synthase complex subunit DHDDS [Episyrphus balteatus]